eukprot:516719_1
MGSCFSTVDRERNLNHLVLPNTLSACVVTWNVNAKDPSNTFGQLLRHNDIPFDIYVIGLQEIVDLNAKNLIINNEQDIKWEYAIESTVNNRKNIKNNIRYKKLRSIGLVGIRLIVYIRDNLLNEINANSIMSSKCASGLFDIAGNKGGVGIRFEIFDTSICFICCHLAAHKGNVKGRNEDYHKIIQKLTFVSENNISETPKTCDEKYSVDSPESSLNINYASNEINLNIKKHNKKSKKSHSASSIDGLSILQHDIVYFLGDLNYRLKFDDTNDVYQLINDKKYNVLLDQDQ